MPKCRSLLIDQTKPWPALVYYCPDSRRDFKISSRLSPKYVPIFPERLSRCIPEDSLRTLWRKNEENSWIASGCTLVGVSRLNFLILFFSFRMSLHEYQIVGRHLPTESEPTPKIYRMRIFATNEVVAKSRFWYFLRCVPSFSSSLPLSSSHLHLFVSQAIEEGQEGQR